MKKLVAGYQVESQPHRFGGDSPNMVLMHRLGKNEIGFFTPTEARELAAFLVEAATSAETDP